MVCESVDVVLPAGGRLDGAFAEEAGAEIKALIRLDGPGGKTVLEHTMEVLRATGRVRRIVIVGPGELAAHPASTGADAVLAEGGSGPENVLRGLAWLRETNGGVAERALVVTTDLPFLTPAAILDFLAACPCEADVCVPVLRREAFDVRFPASPVTFARLKDGEWTMACAFLVNPEAVEANRVHLEKIFAARKSEVAMARVLGLLFVARYVTRRLTVTHIRRRCEEILGCSSAAVTDAPPEIAFDIDKVEELRYARCAIQAVQT